MSIYSFEYLKLISIFIASIFLMYIFIKFKLLNILDTPNKRSMHANKVPRYGGIFFILIPIFSSLIVINSFLQNFFALLFILFLISLLDDIYGLNQLIRLFFHNTCSGLFLYFYFDLNIYIFLSYLFFMVTIINFFNFMDGINGFVSGISLVILFFLLILLKHDSFYEISIFIQYLIMSLFAFFLLNFPNGKIFMGDCGSIALGFIISAFCIYGVETKIINFLQVIFLLAPIILDASITIIKRIWKLEKIWLPHKSHTYQIFFLLCKNKYITTITNIILAIYSGLYSIYVLSSFNFYYFLFGCIPYIIYFFIVNYYILNRDFK